MPLERRALPFIKNAHELVTSECTREKLAPAFREALVFFIQLQVHKGIFFILGRNTTNYHTKFGFDVLPKSES